MEKRYNDSQVKAIGHFNGPCLTLAGPGSGKTAVITERTKNLITKYHVNPSNILVITFTKAAALEMKTRFLSLMGNGSYPVTFGTFHAVYFSILKHAYNYNANNIVREEQKYALMRELVQKHRLEYEDETEFVSSILGEISMVKNTGVSIEHYYSTNCAENIFRRIYGEYHEYLHQHKLIDFDDMLVYTYELFRERKDILSAWQRKFQYILIDEFQDINKIQFDIVKMLAAPENNLFVVGDDDQSIYRFRGARPELMLHFKDDYPEAEQILLDTNYRSQKEIVEASLRLIGCNKERFQKKIQANQEAGEPVEYAVFKSQREEIAKIIWDIQAHMDRGGRYEDFAILFRTNTQPQMLMEKLLEYGSITPEVAQFLQKLVKARYNIFIAGGTGSGKTTFLNALSSYIPHDERIITIEDSAELQITQIPNIVRLETRNATASSGESKKIDIQSLIRSSLRMRPDRIIVGEVRGAEALDMLQAMNTGHDGSLSTGHANSAEDMLSRLETMVLQGEAALPLKAIRQQISSAVDIMIHLSRLRDHSRKTMMVSEILPHLDENGDIRLNPLFEFREDENSTLQHVSGALVRTENPMIQTDKWTRAGFLLEDIPTAK